MESARRKTKVLTLGDKIDPKKSTRLQFLHQKVRRLLLGRYWKNHGDRTNTSRDIHKKHEGRAESAPFSSARVKSQRRKIIFLTLLPAPKFTKLTPDMRHNIVIEHVKRMVEPFQLKKNRIRSTATHWLIVYALRLFVYRLRLRSVLSTEWVEICM